ncbi:MAG TPA: VanZ family protein [Roseiflexaceae bacterium]|nr:VanZ family protein [Roseiflexaceae bacterium]
MARWLAVALWMGLIFAFSAQSRLPSAPQPWLDFLFKKSAHFAVFATLATLLWRGFEWRSRGWLWAWLLTVIYAISDEWHQSFVAGRHPQATDVLIDACGAATALLVVWWIQRRTIELSGISRQSSVLPTDD